MNEIETCTIETVKNLLEPKLSQMFWHEYDLNHEKNEISILNVRCKEKETSPAHTMVLRLVFLNDAKQILLPNIIMPESMKWERLGKRVIKAIFDVAEARGYQLFIVDMVNSFYERMLKRNALPIDSETVLITQETDLTGDVGSPRIDPSKIEVRGFSIFDLLDPEEK